MNNLIAKLIQSPAFGFCNFPPTPIPTPKPVPKPAPCEKIDQLLNLSSTFVLIDIGCPWLVYE